MPSSHVLIPKPPNPYAPTPNPCYYKHMSIRSYVQLKARLLDEA